MDTPAQDDNEAHNNHPTTDADSVLPTDTNIVPTADTTPPSIVHPDVPPKRLPENLPSWIGEHAGRLLEVSMIDEINDTWINLVHNWYMSKSCWALPPQGMGFHLQVDLLPSVSGCRMPAGRAWSSIRMLMKISGRNGSTGGIASILTGDSGRLDDLPLVVRVNGPVCSSLANAGFCWC